jgi:hypothetical protein
MVPDIEMKTQCTFDNADDGVYTKVMLGTRTQISDLRGLDRAIHFLDVENLVGAPLPLAVDVEATRRAYEQAVPIGPRDLVVVATSHVAALPVWRSWPDARRLLRSGPDGADLALLQAIENEDVGRRFNRVVVGSGDGIFAEPCARLQAEGCKLTVVSRARSLSRALRFAVRDVRLLGDSPRLAPPAQVLIDEPTQVLLDGPIVMHEWMEASA